MFAIESVTLVANQRLPLSVSNFASYPDLDLSDEQTKDYDTDVLYNFKSNLVAQRPAVIKPTSGIVLTVKISGLPIDVVGQNVMLSTAGLEYWAFTSSYQSIPSGATEAEFQMSLELTDSSPLPGPWGVMDMVQFNLYTEDLGLIGNQPAPVPLELYVLGASLPAYFDGGVPLLLLRMFILAATQQQVVIPQQWVALVAKICHGSAQPETGYTSQTEDHWLKYNTMDGGSSFMDPNPKNPYHLPDGPDGEQYRDFGGCFYIESWLNAYRNFKKDKTCLSLVNCYDQAGAVEVALSLGIDYECIAWEYHQPYGFITKDANLVGWGKCNNPYFKRHPENKVVDEMSPNRTSFANHAFLSWNPTSNLDPSDFAPTNDPSNYSGMFAIDACAGPHLGNEDRGVWVSPTSYPNATLYPGGYTSNNTTYWRTRDDKYLAQAHLFQKEKTAGVWEPLKNQHVWTPGVTGLNNKNLNRKFDPLYTDPFEGSSINFPDATSFPNPTLAFGGRISDLQDFFSNTLMSTVSGSSNWPQVLLSDIPIASNGILSEIKFYDSTEPAFSFASMKTSVLPSLSDALSAQKARAAQVIITSTLEAVDFETNTGTANGVEQEVFVLQADFTALMVCMNLFVEVSGYIGVNSMKTIISAVEKELAAVPTVDGTQWQKALK